MWNVVLDPGLWCGGALQAVLWIRLLERLSTRLHPRWQYKQVANLVSVVHNVGCLGLITAYWYSGWAELIRCLMVWSISYYGVDLLHYPKWSLMRIHHVVSMLMEMRLGVLCTHPGDVDAQAILAGLFWCEVSNHPLYYVYHREKSTPVSHLDARWYLLELITFAGFRTWAAVRYLWWTPVVSPWVGSVMGAVWLTSLHWALGMGRKYYRAYQ